MLVVAVNDLQVRDTQKIMRELYGLKIRHHTSDLSIGESSEIGKLELEVGVALDVFTRQVSSFV